MTKNLSEQEVMQNNKKLTIAIAVALGTLSAPAFSAGFQLAEYSATGLGRAFAGEAAMADNASAQFRNPAMMTYLEGTQVSVGGIYVAPNIDIDGTNTTLKKATSSNNMADGALVPNFYLTHQINQKWTAGLAVGTNFGMSTKLDDNFLVPSLVMKRLSPQSKLIQMLHIKSTTSSVLVVVFAL